MASDFRVGSAVQPMSTLMELAISCRNLIDSDVFSKSDPMVVLFMQEFGGGRWTEVGRTEVISNTLNPDFAHKFVIKYMFEEHQKMKFEVYDVDSPSPKLQDHDFLGYVECTLGEIVASGSYQRNLLFQSSRPNRGVIIITAEELLNCKIDVTLQFKGKKLDKKDFFGKSDPFLAISKANENSSFTVVHRTEYLKRTLNPTWKPFSISLQKLCNGDEDRSLKFECYDWNSSGSHSLIGEFCTTARTLSKGATQENVYELINAEKKRRKRSYKNSGEVYLLNCVREHRYSFLDYIRGGTELNCTIAIDFTASNGDPNSPQSLHHFNPLFANPYVRALRAVGEIIQDYDSDKMFPVLGFGARLPPNGKVSHEFYVNGSPTNPYCQGVDGVLAAYQQCITSVQLYGPTNFAPVINHVARFATSHRDGSQYFILLIITDGIITDMPQTKDAIISACVLPLSIIIVGVGSADFTAMDELDGDVVRLNHRGVYAQRDIVQFVPFKEFEKESELVGKAKLARAVLAEIPFQFLSYMRMHNIKPNPSKASVQFLPPDPEA